MHRIAREFGLHRQIGKFRLGRRVRQFRLGRRIRKFWHAGNIGYVSLIGIHIVWTGDETINVRAAAAPFRAA